jgi:serine/threonine-protein kinase
MAVERAPGQIIAGRFRLIEKVGEGGMASVWTARHLTLNVDVAVKLMDGAARAGDEGLLKRFDQEAKAAAAIQSPHVVKILDFGHDASKRPYLVMELLQGEELEERLLREGAMTLDLVRRIVRETCKGLTAAHALGIVHRDLKPENLFLVKDPDGATVKLLDFGIARATPEIAGHGSITMTGQLVGTPMFMSPEQALGRRDLDLRSDLYSLGVVAFRCLTGQLPYEEGDTIGELIVSISTKEPTEITKLRPNLPPRVVAWMRKALDKSPARRFSSAREMSEALDAACDVRNLRVTISGFDVDDTVPPAEQLAEARSGVLLDATAALPSGSPDATTGATRRPQRRAWWPWLIAVTLMLTAAGLAAWVKLR